MASLLVSVKNDLELSPGVQEAILILDLLLLDTPGVQRKMALFSKCFVTSTDFSPFAGRVKYLARQQKKRITENIWKRNLIFVPFFHRKCDFLEKVYKQAETFKYTIFELEIGTGLNDVFMEECFPWLREWLNMKLPKDTKSLLKYLVDGGRYEIINKELC